jgi:2-iminoacetate synthase ThiH
MEVKDKQTKVIDWFTEKLKNNELEFKTRVKLFDLLMESLDVMSVSEYARQKQISYNGVLSKIQTGSLNAMTFHGDTFLFEKKKKEVVY